MAHFANVKDGKVLNVIVAEQEFIDTFQNKDHSVWIQTSYNTLANTHLDGGTPMRYNYAQVGGNYDEDADAFYNAQPFPSWTLNKDTYTWEPPVNYPTVSGDEYYHWNEEKQTWDEVT